MLYYIDESCVEVLKQNNENCIAFLEQLALDRRKGKNLVVASRAVLKELSEATQFSSPIRTIYRLLRNRASEFKIIMSKMNRYCRVVAGPISSRIVVEGGQEITYISVIEDAKKDFTDLSVILAENAEDIRLYKRIGQYYLRKEQIRQMQISFDERAGGGDTTYMILKPIIEAERRMCLCVVDSDKKYLGAVSCGDTMQKVLDLRKGKQEVFYEILPLQVHEVENLIPLNILEKVQKRKRLEKEGIEFIKKLISKDSSKTSPVFYFDMKKGILKKNILIKKDADEHEKKRFRRVEPYRNGWLPFLQYDGQMQQLEEEKTAIVPGVCEKILAYSLEEFENMGEQFETYEVDEYMKPYWMLIGSKIVSWGCVGKRLATSV